MPAKVNFEQKIKELEGIVGSLEGGEATLDEMLTLYEKGVKITKECMLALDKADQKITALIKSGDGTMAEEDFEGEE